MAADMRSRGPERRRGLTARVAAAATLTAAATLAAGCGASAGGEPRGATDRAATSPPPGAAPQAEPNRGASIRGLRASLRRARGSGTPIALIERPTRLRARPRGEELAELGSETEFGSPRVLAVVGRRGRWLEVMAAELPNGQTGFVRAGATDVGGVDYSLSVSLGRRVLEVRRRDRLVRSVPVAIGGPATPTPTGTFAVTDKLRMLEHESIYGCCALALTGHQPNVPQGWAGGDRLAVHGTSSEATIGEAASLGCLRAADADIRWLVDRVPLGTLVNVRD